MMVKLLENLSSASKINWAVRVKNPVWWFKVIIAFFTPIFIYYGITGESMDTWEKVANLIVQAVSNPYVLSTAILSAITTSIDPTSTGVTDSAMAMEYSKPNSR